MPSDRLVRWTRRHLGFRVPAAAIAVVGAVIIGAAIQVPKEKAGAKRRRRLERRDLNGTPRQMLTQGQLLGDFDLTIAPPDSIAENHEWGLSDACSSAIAAVNRDTAERPLKASFPAFRSRTRWNRCMQTDLDDPVQVWGRAKWPFLNSTKICRYLYTGAGAGSSTTGGGAFPLPLPISQLAQPLRLPTAITAATAKRISRINPSWSCNRFSKAQNHKNCRGHVTIE